MAAASPPDAPTAPDPAFPVLAIGYLVLALPISLLVDWLASLVGSEDDFRWDEGMFRRVVWAVGWGVLMAAAHPWLRRMSGPRRRPT